MRSQHAISSPEIASLPVVPWWNETSAMRTLPLLRRNRSVRFEQGDGRDAAVDDGGDLGLESLPRTESACAPGRHGFGERARIAGPRLHDRLVVVAPAAVDEPKPDDAEEVSVEVEETVAGILEPVVDAQRRRAGLERQPAFPARRRDRRRGAEYDFGSTW